MNYGWKESQTGLIQVATIPAGLLATAYSGYFMDFLAVRSAKRNNGVHYPEARLPSERLPDWSTSNKTDLFLVIILPSILIIVASVAYGYSLEHPERFGHHWIAPVAFFSMMAFGFISSLITTTTLYVHTASMAWKEGLTIVSVRSSAVLGHLVLHWSSLLEAKTWLLSACHTA